MCSFIIDMYLKNDLKITKNSKSLAMIFHNRARFLKIIPSITKEKKSTVVQ